MSPASMRRTFSRTVYFSNSSRTVLQDCPSSPSRLLFSDLLDLPRPRRQSSGETLDLQKEFPPREKPIERLAPLLHAFHFDACGNMFQIDTARCFVDLLPSPSRGPYEFLLNVLLLDAKGFHLCPKPPILLFADGKRGHPKPIPGPSGLEE